MVDFIPIIPPPLGRLYTGASTHATQTAPSCSGPETALQPIYCHAPHPSQKTNENTFSRWPLPHPELLV